jgi:hypothetical protein
MFGNWDIRSTLSALVTLRNEHEDDKLFFAVSLLHYIFFIVGTFVATPTQFIIELENFKI